MGEFTLLPCLSGLGRTELFDFEQKRNCPLTALEIHF
jgi:hypothetical protein